MMRSSNSQPASSTSRLAPTGKIDAAGLDRDVGAIKERLCEEENELQILPIVGTAGIGKTTLARNVYHDSLIIGRFDIRAWVTVSVDYSFGDIFSSLLVSMKDFVKGEISGLNNQEKAEKVRQTLKDRRYLIVIDDIWSTKIWDEVRIYFPDNSRGSRIMLTTRLENVAAYVDSLKRFHKMQLFLDADQSWNLQKRVLRRESPLTLENIRRKIEESCGGLPLAVMVIAELLSEVSQTEEDCFLYMAGFPEDYEFRVSELLKLWVAEGFLVEHSYGSKSLEETAEEYLKDLVERSLVLVTSRNIDGKIKSCRLHNMVRDVCIGQAGQKKLLLPVMDYLPSPILRRHFLPQVLKNHQHISASWCDLDLKDSMHSSCTHSIICIQQKGYRPKGSVQNFSSLRVLHVLRRDDRWYCELGQVFDLIHLRSGVCLPMEIWSLRQLRHLIAFSFDPLPRPEAAALPLENLQTLSLATDFRDEMVKMIPNIQKLGICYSREKFDEGYHLNSLTHLFQLEKLKLEMHSGSFWPSLSPVFPMSLKKLTLSGCRLPWRDMTIIGSLPTLQVLKLRKYAFDGEQWKTTDGEFLSLMLLLIDESNVQHWESRSSHFPRLKCLKLPRCPYLSEIPIAFGDITTLELIEVDDGNQSLLYSAKRIQEEQEGYYGIDQCLEVRLKRF